MNRSIKFGFLLALLCMVYTAGGATAPGQEKTAATQWHAAQQFGVRGLGWEELAQTFTRLPAKAQGVVSEEVWRLGQNSAGLHVRFVSNSKSIKVKWSVRGNVSLNHMAATAVKGVDLYARSPQGWQWVGVGKPSGKKNEAEVVTNMAPGEREFLLYLPLYDGVDSVAIGVENGASISAAAPYEKKPIVFYGTSITQGACATRAGMAYPSIIGRCLNRETINLGFSGNGKMDPAMANLLAELDPTLYVLDCLPNMKPEEVQPRTLEVVRLLKAKRPDTPILLVENITYAHVWIDQRVADVVQKKNQALRKAYEQLAAEGVKKLYYRNTKDLVNPNGEGTVDGIHLTDLGFTHLANALVKEIKTIDKKNKLK
ncbi:SGNH/GDSL hydrolase family protein [Rufibacter immobilis]|uniref:SGNH/GDSL hydrolase family protein n=1 Tax=Rufibacter immobilis TaxID=1348778 RepID=UPI0035EF32D0